METLNTPLFFRYIPIFHLNLYFTLPLHYIHSHHLLAITLSIKQQVSLGFKCFFLNQQMLQFPGFCDSRPKKSCKGKHWIVQHLRTILMDSTPRFQKRWISICSNTVLWKCVSKQNQHFPIDIEVTVRSTGRTKSLRFEENAFVRKDPIRRRSIGKEGMRMKASRVEFKHKEIMSRRHTNRCALKPKGAKYLSVTSYSNRSKETHGVVHTKSLWISFRRKRLTHPTIKRLRFYFHKKHTETKHSNLQGKFQRWL